MKGDVKWADHLERLANDWHYARMAEEELPVENLLSMLNFNEKWNRKLIQKNN